MIRNISAPFFSILLLAGCVAYEPAVFVDGVISNPKVGWNGYAVRVPPGLTTLETSADENAPDRESEIRNWYDEEASSYAGDYYTSFSEQFIFEPLDQSYFLSFISETYELSTGWGMLSSVDKQFIIQEMIRRKMVIINDMDAGSEQIEINGQRGWYISGEAKPYFKKKAVPVTYEGILLLGSLKEVYWFEAFGEEASRVEMKQKVYEMAGNLEVK